MAAKKKVIPTVEATLSALSESPPKGKQKGAKSFKKLEALTAIPDGLSGTARAVLAKVRAARL